MKEYFKVGAGIIGIIVILDSNSLIKRILSPGGGARVSRTTSEIIGGTNLWGSFSWLLIFAIFQP